MGWGCSCRWADDAAPAGRSGQRCAAPARRGRAAPWLAQRRPRLQHLPIPRSRAEVRPEPCVALATDPVTARRYYFAGAVLLSTAACRRWADSEAVAALIGFDPDDSRGALKGESTVRRPNTVRPVRDGWGAWEPAEVGQRSHFRGRTGPDLALELLERTAGHRRRCRRCRRTIAENAAKRGEAWSVCGPCVQTIEDEAQQLEIAPPLIRRCLVCQDPIGHRRRSPRTCGNACRNAPVEDPRRAMRRNPHSVRHPVTQHRPREVADRSRGAADLSTARIAGPHDPRPGSPVAT